MANTADTFVFVSHHGLLKLNFYTPTCTISCKYSQDLVSISVYLTIVQELSNHVGLNVAQASSESIGAREIHELIEKDVPQVHKCANSVCVCVCVCICLHVPKY
jgi:hypothetical protein